MTGKNLKNNPQNDLYKGIRQKTINTKKLRRLSMRAIIILVHSCCKRKDEVCPDAVVER
jgi:hypothetical protein